MSKKTINEVFYWCVNFLRVWAAKLNMTYEEINIWIFCIIWPVLSVLAIVWLIYLLVKVRWLKKQLNYYRL